MKRLGDSKRSTRSNATLNSNTTSAGRPARKRQLSDNADDGCSDGASASAAAATAARKAVKKGGGGAPSSPTKKSSISNSNSKPSTSNSNDGDFTTFIVAAPEKLDGAVTPVVKFALDAATCAAVVAKAAAKARALADEEEEAEEEEAAAAARAAAFAAAASASEDDDGQVPVEEDEEEDEEDDGEGPSAPVSPTQQATKSGDTGAAPSPADLPGAAAAAEEGSHLTRFPWPAAAPATADAAAAVAASTAVSNAASAAAAAAAVSRGRAPGIVRPGGAEASRAALRRLRSELLDVEEAVPWSAVRAAWRGRRPAWRRALRGSDAAAPLARAVREFRGALVDDAPSEALHVLSGVERWDAAVAAVGSGAAPGAALHALWAEFREGLASWVGAAPRRPGRPPLLLPDILGRRGGAIGGRGHALPASASLFREEGCLEWARLRGAALPPRRRRRRVLLRAAGPQAGGPSGLGDGRRRRPRAAARLGPRGSRGSSPRGRCEKRRRSLGSGNGSGGCSLGRSFRLLAAAAAPLVLPRRGPEERDR